MSEDWGEEPMDPAAPPLPALPGVAERVKDLLGPAVQAFVDKSVRSAVKEAVEGRLRDRLDTLFEGALGVGVEDQIDAQVESTLRAALDAGTLTEEPEGQAPELHFGSVDEFYREWLRFSYRRRIDGRTRLWAADWWRYEEAVNRLEALWRAWEHLRLDPATGMSVWHRDHLDHHMPILMSESGPFAAAPESEANTCGRGEPLPYMEPPNGMFPDVRLTA